ncbi:heavy metal sensor histidine kinase [Pseudomonas silvicola]|nr:heavy metal sensor histidine kinase [Pseudomonas silvicola]
MSEPARGPSLAWRLATAFALVCALVLGVAGIFLYRSLESELVYRDDQALLGRLEQVRALIQDSDSLDALQQRPRLYQNMLANQESLLLVNRADGTPVITINPWQQALPPLTPIAEQRSAQASDIQRWPTLMLLAGATQGPRGEALTVVVGKRLAEREAMLASYRLRVYLAIGLGGLLAFALGLLLLRRALWPLRHMTETVAGIDLCSLGRRLRLQAIPRELHEPVQALNGMLARLDESFQRLSQFSADLAHEIRTPLHNLLGSNGLALNQPRSSAEYQELLASNLEEFERLNRMVENLLFLARADHGERLLNRQLIELHDLGEDLCAYFEALAEDRGLQLQNQLQGSLHADLQLVQRALANLLANAVRHAAAGSTVILGAARGRLFVSNEGEPIGAAHVGKLFDRFYRVDPSRAAPGDSGGLGLAIVRSIMHLHGGTVDVSSDEHATVFSLVFDTDAPRSGPGRAPGAA